MKNYYKDQLNRIKIDPVYSPSIKIHGNNGEAGNETKYLNLNKESAQILIDWLTDNFIKKTRFQYKIDQAICIVFYWIMFIIILFIYNLIKNL